MAWIGWLSVEYYQSVCVLAQWPRADAMLAHANIHLRRLFFAVTYAHLHANRWPNQQSKIMSPASENKILIDLFVCAECTR